MTRHAVVIAPFVALLLVGCKDPIPEEALAAAKNAVDQCNACLELAPEKTGPCVREASEQMAKAEGELIPRPEADYDEESRARYSALRKALTECGEVAHRAREASR